MWEAPSAPANCSNYGFNMQRSLGGAFCFISFSFQIFKQLLVTCYTSKILIATRKARYNSQWMWMWFRWGAVISLARAPSTPDFAKIYLPEAPPRHLANLKETIWVKRSSLVVFGHGGCRAPGHAAASPQASLGGPRRQEGGTERRYAPWQPSRL